MSNHIAAEGSHAAGAIALVPARGFSLTELVAIYNQARSDYLVPMQMDELQLAAYLLLYDIDLAQSVVAVDGGERLGLAMLGVRPGQTWVTRLGVLPGQRRRGTGEAMLRALIENTRKLGCCTSLLEVIQGNQAARSLFAKAGFVETRELLVLSRPPGAASGEILGRAQWLDREEAVDRLRGYRIRQPWTNALETYLKPGIVEGIEVETETGARGWLVYRRREMRLTHFSLHCVEGDAHELGLALGRHLYHRFPLHETYIENVTADHPFLGALTDLGFCEAFRRIEMALTVS